MATPLFTVVTATYRSARFVREAIDSVLASSYTDFEYLIADDCSPDDTWDIIQTYSDDRIVAWRNEQNLGEYRNRNLALQKARGRFLIFVDGDDVLYRHTLRNLAEYISFFPDVDMIWGVPSSQFSFAILPYCFRGTELLELIYGSSIPLATIGFAETVFSIQKLRDVGGFSEQYGIGDTYIKKKMAIDSNTLLVPLGMVFWRHSANQASSVLRHSRRGFEESFLIDMEVLAAVNWLGRPELRGQLIGSFLRRLFNISVRRGDTGLFFRLLKRVGLSWRDLQHFTKRYRYFFPHQDLSEQPLRNSFHFQREIKERAN